MTKKIYLVPHTHWDREWYLTFGEYRSYLLRVLDKIVDMLYSGELEYFLLDGQVSAIEDYLKIRREKEKHVIELVKKGKLGVGPWFTQPDEFLVSGESLVRNLLYGLRKCEKYGRCEKIGYLPDIFGHTPQLPQILNGFGLDTFVFSRGYDASSGCDFIWEAPDGSKVFSHYLPDGYCHGALLGVKDKPVDFLFLFGTQYGGFFPYFTTYEFGYTVDIDAAVKKVSKIIKRYSKCSNIESILILNGCDHLPLQQELNSIIERLREKYDVVVGGLNEFFNELRKRKDELPVLRGELRKVKHRPILTEVLSSRVYLKQLNFTAEKLLTMYLEPISLISEYLGLTSYPVILLDELWENLLLNHAHDSICGTSIDEVHVDNEARFNHVIRVANSEIAQLLGKIGNNTKASAPKVVLFNPNPWSTSGPVKVYFSGKALAKKSVLNGGVLSPILWLDYVEFESVKYRTGLFIVRELQGLGYYTLKLTDKANERKNGLRVNQTEIVAKNYTYKVLLEKGGALQITSNKERNVIGIFNILVDEGDVGDEYNYDRPDRDLVVSSENHKAKLSSVKFNSEIAVIKVNLEMELPEGAEGRKRSNNKVKQEFEITYTFYYELDRVDVEIRFHNKVKDHRLKALHRLNIRANEVFEEVHFYENKRKIIDKEPRKMPWSIEVQPRVHPYHDYIYIKNGDTGVMFASRGLYEYVAKREKDGVAVYLTLLRSVGYLSRKNLKSRYGHAGPGLETPGAQCLREVSVQYAIIPFKDRWEAIKLAKNFTQPIIGVQVNLSGNLEDELTFLKINGRDYQHTALKKPLNWGKVLLRVFNLKGDENEVEVEFVGDFDSVVETNLLEETKLSEQRSRNITLRPYGIHTLVFE